MANPTVLSPFPGTLYVMALAGPLRFPPGAPPGPHSHPGGTMVWKVIAITIAALMVGLLVVAPLLLSAGYAVVGR